MSKKPIRKKTYTKQVSLKVYEKPQGRSFERSKFFMGSAFMLLLSGFVMYKSLLSDNVVLGAHTTRLIAENKGTEAYSENVNDPKENLVRGDDQLMPPMFLDEESVTVLPEEVMGRISDQGYGLQATNSGEDLKVVEENGELVYKVEILEQKKFLGVLPVKLRSRFRVSAVDGSVMRERGNVVNGFFRLFSF